MRRSRRLQRRRPRRWRRECAAGPVGSDTGGSIRQPAACAAWSGSNPPMAASADMGWWPSHRASTRSELLAGPSAMWRCNSMFWRARSQGFDLLWAMCRRILPHSIWKFPGAAPREWSRNFSSPRAWTRRCIARWIVRCGFTSSGREIVDVSLPHSHFAIAAYYVIAPCEASSNLARYDGVHFGHRTREPVKDIIELFSKSRAEGFGDGSATPHHDRNLRPFQRVLRCVLPAAVKVRR